MMKEINENPNVPDAGRHSQNSQDHLRRIPARRVAALRRRMDGAEKRKIRLETELTECRATIRRKYTERTDKHGDLIEQVPLTAPHVAGLRLKRIGIERELAVAKGDYLISKREYRKAVQHNIEVGRKSVKFVREENRIRREANKLLRRTRVALEKHSAHGGAEEMKRLQEIAASGEVKEFRRAFDDLLHRLDPDHHNTISWVSQVKTEIVHALMEHLAEEGRKLNGEISDKGGAR